MELTTTFWTRCIDMVFNLLQTEMPQMPALSPEGKASARRSVTIRALTVPRDMSGNDVICMVLESTWATCLRKAIDIVRNPRCLEGEDQRTK